MVMMDFLKISQEEIWRKKTSYILTMYGMFLKDQDAKEAEALQQRQDNAKGK